MMNMLITIIIILLVVIIEVWTKAVATTTSRCIFRSLQFGPGLVSITFFISLDVGSHVLVLLKKEPEHTVEFFSALDHLNFRVTAHLANFFLEDLDCLNVMLLELGQVAHDILIRNIEVLFELVVKGLPADLNTDTQCNIDINDLLFECRGQDSQMSLPRFLDWIILMISCRHDLI